MKQEQWEIRWRNYYQVFQLQPDAEHEVISAVYKRLAAKYHPDNQETGNEEKFKLLNEANEVLSDPARRAAYDAVYKQRQLTNGPHHQAAEEKQKRRAAAAQKAREEQRQREEQARQRQQEEEAWRKKQLPIVYPLIQRPFRYQLYDYLNRSSDGNENAGLSGLVVILGIFVLILPPGLLFRLGASLVGQDPAQLLDSSSVGLGFLGVIGLWGTFVFGNLYADDCLYQIHTARKPQTAWLQPRRVWEAVEQVFNIYRYHGHGWSFAGKTADAEDATEKFVARFAFSYKLLGFIELPYVLTVTIKVKESELAGASQVCYWFDEQRPWYWLLPAATVVKHTNTLLQKVLAGETLPPEVQPLTPEKRRADILKGVMYVGATAVFVFVMGFLAQRFSLWLEQLRHASSTSFADVLLGLLYVALSLGCIGLAFGGGIVLIFFIIDVIRTAVRSQG